MPTTSFHMTTSDKEMLNFICKHLDSTMSAVLRRLIIQEHTKIKLKEEK